MKYEPGSIIRFTYNHQDRDASTGDKFKEVLVLNPLWNNKMHGIDLKRCTPAERRVLEDILDPELKDKPSPIPLINDIKRRMDPIELIRNPVAFYTKFLKPFMRKKDMYRQYVPARMTGITVVRNMKITGQKKGPEKPLFGPKPGTAPQQGAEKPLTPIDVMKQNAAAKGLK